MTDSTAVGAWRACAPTTMLLWLPCSAALILLADVRLSLFAYALAGSYALYEAMRLKRLRRLWAFVPARCC